MSNSYINANEELHRLDGPAVEWANGTKEWWINGQRHRIDGPAIEYADGTKSWWIDGKLHRIDGPAIEYANGRKSWWINDKEVTNEVNNWLSENNVTYPFDEDGLVLFKMRWL